MRAIDADALIRKLTSVKVTFGSGNGLVEGGLGIAISEAHNMPTIDPERKKGKWYKPTGMMPPEFTGQYRCSECDELALRDWKHHKQELTRYCPNCGARMEGDE